MNKKGASIVIVILERIVILPLLCIIIVNPKPPLISIVKLFNSEMEKYALFFGILTLSESDQTLSSSRISFALTLIGLSVLSVFLLCSLSYNPIIAEKPIIETKQDIDIIEDEDCGCNPKSLWNFPVICSLLLPIVIFSLYMWAWFGILPFGNTLDYLIKKLDCWWESSLDLMITVGE